MKKTLILLVLLLFVSACSRKEKRTAEEVSTVANDYPNFNITLADGKTVHAKTFTGKVLLILFQPDCDHCQHEAHDIEKNLSAFRDHTLYFVSSSPMAEIKNFAVDYKLAGIPNVMFGWTSTDNIINNFGPVQAPSVYIYSAEGKLVRHFNGQVAIGEILRYL